MRLLTRAFAPVGVLTLAVLASACTKPPPVPPEGDPAKTIDCSAVEVVVVRGSGEPANGGSHVGKIARQVADTIPGSTYYDVPYPATFDFASSLPQGISDFLNHLLAQAAKCPDQRYVLAAHSQGTMVLQYAYARIPDAVSDRVPAVILFGSPFFTSTSPAARGTARNTLNVTEGLPAKWEAKALTFCNKGDIVCGAGLSIPAHYTYDNPTEVGQATEFVHAKLGQ